MHVYGAKRVLCGTCRFGCCSGILSKARPASRTKKKFARKAKKSARQLSELEIKKELTVVVTE